MLNTLVHGAATDAPPLVIAHGLYGSGRNWGVIAKRLSNERQVITVDMRNHGESPWHSTHSYDDLAQDLAQVMASLGGPVDLLGHSMGGKAAMQLALTRPGPINRLIVADIAPVAYSHTQAHLIQAMRAVDLSALTRRAEAGDQMAQNVPDPGVRAFLLQSLDVKAKRWMLNLDVLEREMDKIIGWPGTQGRFDGPALFLTGALSDYVQPAHHAAIRDQFPAARFQAIAGAGHWVHAEQPRAFEDAARGFLNGTDQAE